MTAWWIGSVLGLLLSAAGHAPASAAPPAAPPGPVWHTDYGRAKELARRQGKPLFAVFR